MGGAEAVAQWSSMLPKGIRPGLNQAILELVEETTRLVSSGSSVPECAGVLYWEPVGVDVATGSWVLEMNFMSVPGAGEGLDGSFIIDSGAVLDEIISAVHTSAVAVWHSCDFDAGEVIRGHVDGNVRPLLPSGLDDPVTFVRWMAELPQVIFGVVHTHPGGRVGPSAGDVAAESHAVDDWREASNVWSAAAVGLGKPSSFVLALDTSDGVSVSGISRYDASGVLVEWTPSE